MVLTLLEVTLAFLVLAFAFTTYRFWRSHLLHIRCVRLCHRIADELCRKQEPELVTERIFKAIIDHTNAAIAVLSLRSGENGDYRVIQVHGVRDDVLSPDGPPGRETGWLYPEKIAPGRTRIVYSGLKDRLWFSAGIRIGMNQNMICIPVSGPGDISGVLQIVSSPGRMFTRQHLSDLGGAGLYLGAAIYNATLISTISRQRDAAEILYEIGLNISQFLDLDKVIEYAVAQGHRVLRSDLTWYLDCPDGVDKRLKIRKMAGALAGDFDIGSRIPISGQVAALLHPAQETTSSSSLVFKDIQSLDPKDLFCDQGVYQQFKALGIHSALIVPVRDMQGARGLLCSFSRDIHTYRDFDTNLMKRLSNHLLIALNTADLHARQQRIAVNEERKRLSDELHDNMSQVINGLSLELHSLVRRGRRFGVSDELLHRLDHLGVVIQDAKATIREAIFELRLPEENQLWKSLQEFSIAFERWHELQVSTRFPKRALSLPLELQREVLRIVQEMLWNALRHSGTNRAWLTGAYDGETRLARIQVSDQGNGADAYHIERGQGFATMRSRAARLNGRLEVQSTPGQGLNITLEFPVRA